MNYQVYKAIEQNDIARYQAISREVFIEELKMNESLVFDGKDSKCVHFIACHIDAPVAAVRIQNAGNTARIERMAVLQTFRRTGAGKVLMEAALDYAEIANFQHAILGAQDGIVSFYEQFGFTPFGPKQEIAGIAHQNMRLKLSERIRQDAAA